MDLRLLTVPSCKGSWEMWFLAGPSYAYLKIKGPATGEKRVHLEILASMMGRVWYQEISQVGGVKAQVRGGGLN